MVGNHRDQEKSHVRVKLLALKSGSLKYQLHGTCAINYTKVSLKFQLRILHIYCFSPLEELILRRLSSDAIDKVRS